jgi:hypothetical protein
MRVTSVCMESHEKDPRARQLAVGIGILLVLLLLIPALLVGWRYLPGLAGEWLGVIAGLMSTPFLLEASFLIIGLVIVIAVNHWRQRRDGDELVYLEQIDGPDLPGDLPDQAKWAVYRDEPLSGVEPSLLERAEGAMAIRDFETAGACLAEMSEDELRHPDVRELRIALATATGRADLARRLAGGDVAGGD